MLAGEHGNMPLANIKYDKHLISWATVGVSKRTLLHGVSYHNNGYFGLLAFSCLGSPISELDNSETRIPLGF
jgi:hypothetical protein